MVGCMEFHDAVEDGTLLLGDGRRLGYALYGRPGGEPLFYFHGHPGSRLEARFAHQAAAEAGLRVIALDRPGYGLSDFQPGQAITDWPADVAEAAGLLRIGRFSVAGASGGGPYALACAWRLPGQVIQAAVISGVGPYQVPGITRGMRWRNRIAFQWGARWPALARALMRSMHGNITSRPERTIEALARAMSPVDAAVVRRPGVRNVLIADLTEAFRQGIQGAALDVVLLGRPWGFVLREIQPVVHLWQGEADTLVPAAMGKYQAAQIPRCHFTLLTVQARTTCGDADRNRGHPRPQSGGVCALHAVDRMAAMPDGHGQFVGCARADGQAVRKGGFGDQQGTRDVQASSSAISCLPSC
jgi:pimeloyl-ACP methyl ester carboxylesterase